MREPLEVHVTVKTDDEVLALRARVAELETAAERARTEYNKVEFRYRCESIVNMELLDLCREHGIKYRRSLEQRPW